MKNLDPDQKREILGQMLGNSIAPVFHKKTNDDRVAEMTNEQYKLLRQNAIGFAEPPTGREKIFKKVAPGLWKVWAAWKELQ